MVGMSLPLTFEAKSSASSSFLSDRDQVRLGAQKHAAAGNSRCGARPLAQRAAAQHLEFFARSQDHDLTLG
jgi:hypothetical protein